MNQVAGVNFLDLRQCHDVAGNGSGYFNRFSALNLQDVTGLEAFSFIADCERAVAGKFSLEDSYPRKFPDERVGGDSEGLGNERFIDVGCDFDGFGVLAFTVENLSGGNVRRRREILRYRIGQFRYAHLLATCREEKRYHRPGGHRAGERAAEFVGGNLFAAKIGLHHLLVGLDDRFDKLRVRFGDVAEIGRTRIVTEAIDDLFTIVGREVHALDRLAEGFGYRFQKGR